MLIQFRRWYNWFSSQAWYFKLLLLIIIFRPIIDNFFYLKEISPYVSPLYYVGVLSIIFCLIAIIRKKRFGNTIIDIDFLLWGFLIFFSIILMIMKEGLTFRSLQYVFKLPLPILLFFCLRRLITNQFSFEAVLQATLYACYIAFVLLLYEIIFGGIRIEYTRNSIERYQANFADVLNYAGYFIFSLVLATYNFFKNRGTVRFGVSIRSFIFILIIVVLGLLKINHFTTYTAFLVLLSIFLFYNLKKATVFVLVFSVLFIFLFIVFDGQKIINQNITPLIETDLDVLEGDRSENYLFHGRMGRWQDIMELFSGSGFIPKLLGYPWSFGERSGFLTSGTHNDFIRVLMLSGIIGLVTYLLIIFKILRQKNQFASIRYLNISSMAILLVYSFSTVPSYYPNFLYFIIPIMAFNALPIKMRYSL